MGIFSAAPSRMFVPDSPLADLIFSTVVPYFLARLQSESPDFTTCLLLPPLLFLAVLPPLLLFLAVEPEEELEVDFLGGVDETFFRPLDDELELVVVLRRGGGLSSTS